MNDKEIIVLLQRQLEVSQATIEGLRTALSEMKSTIEDLKKNDTVARTGSQGQGGGDGQNKEGSQKCSRPHGEAQ